MDYHDLKLKMKEAIQDRGIGKVQEVMEKAIEELAISDEEAFKIIDLSVIKYKKKQLDTASKNTKERISSVAIKYGLELINGRCKCPFHDGENNTSFLLDDERNTFVCFSCGVKGDIFTFIKLMEDRR